MTIEGISAFAIFFLAIIAIAAFQAGRKFESRERDHALRQPGTVTGEQISRIEDLCHELDRQEPDDLRDWSWHGAFDLLHSLRTRKLEMESYMRRVERGGTRSAPLEYVYGVDWDEEKSTWVPNPLRNRDGPVTVNPEGGPPSQPVRR